MSHGLVDRYSDLDSTIHRLDPRTKVVVTLALVLAIVSTPPTSWPAFGLYAALLAVLVGLSRLPVGYVLKRSLVAEPFVLLAALFIPFVKPGQPVVSLDIWMWRLSVSDSGLLLLASVLVKAWLSVLSAVVLTSTTPLPRLLQGLERLKLPRVLIMTISFMYRYVFVIVDEAMRLKRARDSRNFGGGGLRQIRTVGYMVGTLFLRSYERAERVYAAMASRGFDGQSRTLTRLSLKRADLGLGGAFLALVLTVSLAGRWVWP